VEAVSIAKAVQSWRVRPFEYGTSDCCAFCEHVVKAMTGQSYLPAYTDPNAILTALGGLEGAVSASLGHGPSELSDLKAGDLALLRVFDEESLGIVVDDAHAVTLFQDGMPRYLSMAFAEKGWNI